MNTNGTPANVGSNDGLGQEPERDSLTAALDVSGSVVLMNSAGDIVFYAADGKMEVRRMGLECDNCTSTNLRLAESVASAWNAALLRTTPPVRNNCTGLRPNAELSGPPARR